MDRLDEAAGRLPADALVTGEPLGSERGAFVRTGHTESRVADMR
jgi:hypothetical protein